MPELPPRMSRLNELAHDLWWSWNADARHAFRRLDYPLWRLTAHNPVRMLKLVSPETLEREMRDTEWLANYDRATARLDAARAAHNTWCEREYPEFAGRTIAYFSAEFALHQSLPIYAGGLGVLAGDHCKEASDLGVPLVGIGLFYRHGYFRQSLSADGWQEERYPDLDPHAYDEKTAMPTWEEIYSWGLTAAERAMLGREGVYVRTDVLGSG